MEKIGKKINRDFEFTGSVDMVVGLKSRLLENLRKKGFEVPKPEGIPSRKIDFPVEALAGELKTETISIDLTDEQEEAAKEILGYKPSKLVISIVLEEASADISLTDTQKQKIEKALGIDMESVFISREPIEVTLK